MWEEPPQRKKTMADFAGFLAPIAEGGETPAARLEPLRSPVKAAVEAVRKVLRFIDGKNRGGFGIADKHHARIDGPWVVRVRVHLDPTFCGWRIHCLNAPPRPQRGQCFNPGRLPD